MSKKKKILPIIILILIFGILFLGGYTYKKYYQNYLNDIENLKVIEEEIKKQIPHEVMEELSINLNNFEEIIITVNSLNKSVITDSLKVIRPTYLEDDKVVTIEFTITFFPVDPIKNIIYQYLGNSYSFTVDVKVKKQEISKREILEKVASELYLPKITKSSFALPTTISYYEGLEIEWFSSNQDIMTNTGEVVNTGSLILTAILKYGNEQKEISYNLQVVSEFEEIIEVFEDFQNVTTSTTYNTEKTFSGFVATNGIVENEELKLRMPNNATVEYKNVIYNPQKFSFTYQALTSSAFTKDVYIIVMISNDKGLTWTEKEKIKVADNNNHFYEVDLSNYKSINLKITTYANYATMYLVIDNIKITRSINEEDVKNELGKILPKYLDSSILLPFTTPYGGKVSWQSSNETILTNDGYLKEVNTDATIILTATIYGIIEEFTATFEVKILSENFKLPVYIYFLDLGKYGDSDTGEAFYFKIGTIDILVDSGDNYDSTRKSLSEVIEKNSEDKVIDYVIATHPDSDHIGSMKYIFDTYDVLNVIYFEGSHTTNVYKNFITAINNENLVSECTILKAINNEGACKREIELVKDVKIRFIDTESYTNSEPNARSIVFTFEAYGTKILFPGDADKVENKYLNKVGNVNILKIVHHGSRYGTSTELLKAIDPEYVIITNGNYFGNKHGHPTYEAINRIYAYDNKINIYATVGGDSKECSLSTSYECTHQDRFVDRNGTITLTITKDGFTFTSEYKNPILELSKTNFWITHPKKEYEHLFSN